MHRTEINAGFASHLIRCKSSRPRSRSTALRVFTTALCEHRVGAIFSGFRSADGYPCRRQEIAENKTAGTCDDVSLIVQPFPWDFAISRMWSARVISVRIVYLRRVPVLFS